MITHDNCEPWEQEISDLKNKIQGLMLEREQARLIIQKTNDDYWFMINLIEKYSSDKDQALDDCLQRMKFRKPMYENYLKTKN